jgi:hypothetical protein
MIENLLAFATGFMLAMGLAQWWWQSELVERGHAEYHPKTGEWQWKEPEQ